MRFDEVNQNLPHTRFIVRKHAWMIVYFYPDIDHGHGIIVPHKLP
jgi:hypothetical protein